MFEDPVMDLAEGEEPVEEGSVVDLVVDEGPVVRQVEELDKVVDEEQCFYLCHRSS